MTENIDRSAEELRAIASDYAETFNAPAGKRVLAHLLDLLGEGRVHGLANVTPERALYILALHDVAEGIKNMIGRSFDPARPVIRTSRFAQPVSRFSPRGGH